MTDLAAFIAGQENKTISVAVCDLDRGQEILINADEAFHPASTIKVHVMMEVFHQAEQGRFALQDHLPVVNSFASIVDGSRFSLREGDDSEQTLYSRIGQTESILELTRLMIVRSSNLAANLLLEHIGTSQVNEMIRALGIPDVRVVRGIEDNVAFRLGINNSATARGLTHTLRLLAEGNVFSRQASEKMVSILLGQEFRQRIPALLPASVKVAHKPGWTGNVEHDTGIVFPENREPYIVTIMTRGFAESQAAEAHLCMAQISKLVYETLL